MDIAIFIFALFQLVNRKYHWVFAAIFILASSWLEIWFGADAINSVVMFDHKTTDTGIVLYGITFAYSMKFYGPNRFPILIKTISLFFIFILVSVIVDIFNNVSISDIIRYCRGWIYLTVIWMNPWMYARQVDKTLRIILFVVFVTTIIIIWQNLTHTYTFALPINEERGIKPSFFVMLFIPLLFFNAIKYIQLFKWVVIVAFGFAIVMNLKQTYLLTVVLVLLTYVLIYQRKQTSKLFIYSLFIITGSVVLFYSNDKIRNRIEESLTVKESIKTETRESNASYRLLHTIERFNYLAKETKTLVRGIGFIHEESFNETPFSVGNRNVITGEKVQLDTPDIAWSNFFVRLGLLGTGIFIFMYVSIIVELFRQSKFSTLSRVFCVFLIICLVFTSFGNAVINYGYFYLLPLMILSALNNKRYLFYENSSRQFYFSSRRYTSFTC